VALVLKKTKSSNPHHMIQQCCKQIKQQKQACKIMSMIAFN